MHQLNEKFNFRDDASVQLVALIFPELLLFCLLACALIEREELINTCLSLFDIL